MPKGVPYRIQVAGQGSRSYTFTEIAEGTGLSLSLVSLVLRGKRPLSEYAQPRLAEFFGITIEQLGTPGTLTAVTPPVYRPGRIVARARRGSLYRPPLRTWETAMREMESAPPWESPDF